MDIEEISTKAKARSARHEAMSKDKNLANEVRNNHHDLAHLFGSAANYAALALSGRYEGQQLQGFTADAQRGWQDAIDAETFYGLTPSND